MQIIANKFSCAYSLYCVLQSNKKTQSKYFVLIYTHTTGGKKKEEEEQEEIIMTLLKRIGYTKDTTVPTPVDKALSVYGQLVKPHTLTAISNPVSTCQAKRVTLIRFKPI